MQRYLAFYSHNEQSCLSFLTIHPFLFSPQPTNSHNVVSPFDLVPCVQGPYSITLASVPLKCAHSVTPKQPGLSKVSVSKQLIMTIVSSDCHSSRRVTCVKLECAAFLYDAMETIDNGLL